MIKPLAGSSSVFPRNLVAILIALLFGGLLPRTLQAQFGGDGGGRPSQRLDEAAAGGTVESGELFGYALTTGDFDGDGRDDVAVGAPYETLFGMTESGTVRVVFGGPTGINSRLAPQRLNEEEAGGTLEDQDHFGFAVAAGDFNGDSFADLAAAAPNETLFSNTQSGVVRVIYGHPDGLAGGTTQRVDEAAAGGTIEPGDHFGTTLTTGDFNGDGIADLAISTPGESISGADNAGRVRVVFGSPLGLGSGLASQRIDEATAGGTTEANEQFGEVLASGDFDGDGFDDLAFGTPDETIFDIERAGVVRVIYGSAAGLTPGMGRTQRFTETEAGGTSEAQDRFGQSLASGDFDGDSYDDLAVGTPHESTYGHDDAGRV